VKPPFARIVRTAAANLLRCAAFSAGVPRLAFADPSGIAGFLVFVFLLIMHLSDI
jgi:hypothetical protein